MSGQASLAHLTPWSSFSPIMFCSLSLGPGPLELLWRWPKLPVSLPVAVAPGFHFLGSLVNWKQSSTLAFHSWTFPMLCLWFALFPFLPLPVTLPIPWPGSLTFYFSHFPHWSHGTKTGPWKQMLSLCFSNHVCIFLWGHLSPLLV